MNRIGSLRSAAPETDWKPASDVPPSPASAIPSDPVVLLFHAGQHGGGVGEQRMKDRHLGAGLTVVADRPHPRDAAGGRSDHRLRPDHAHGVADQEFGIAAVTGGKPAAKQVFLVAKGVEDLPLGPVFERAARACLCAGRLAVAQIAFGDMADLGLVHNAGIGAAGGAQQAADALLRRPVDHAAVAVLGERAGRTVHHADRIGALPAERELEALARGGGHDADARMRDIIGARFRLRAGDHAVAAAVAAAGAKLQGAEADPHCALLAPEL